MASIQTATTYSIGEIGKEKDMLLFPDQDDNLLAAARLRPNDPCFVLRSTGKYAFARVTKRERRGSSGAWQLEVLVSDAGSTKVIPLKQQTCRYIRVLKNKSTRHRQSGSTEAVDPPVASNGHLAVLRRAGSTREQSDLGRPRHARQRTRHSRSFGGLRRRGVCALRSSLTADALSAYEKQSLRTLDQSSCDSISETNEENTNDSFLSRELGVEGAASRARAARKEDERHTKRCNELDESLRTLDLSSSDMEPWASSDDDYMERRNGAGGSSIGTASDATHACAPIRQRRVTEECHPPAGIGAMRKLHLPRHGFDDVSFNEQSLLAAFRSISRA